MKEPEFEKLFSEHHAALSASVNDQREFDDMTDDERMSFVQKNEEPIPAELNTKIQEFIRNHKGKPKRQIRRLVKKKFNIEIV